MHQAILELKDKDLQACMTKEIFRIGGDQSSGLEYFCLVGYHTMKADKNQLAFGWNTLQQAEISACFMLVSCLTCFSVLMFGAEYGSLHYSDICYFLAPCLTEAP